MTGTIHLSCNKRKTYGRYVMIFPKLREGGGAWGRDTGKITEEYFAIESCIFLSLSQE